ncbi:Single-stranded DNA binding protein Ssb [Candidatus Burarchaeum australiense]|nr:Single-stranded DNA binding protein Ssb [Candidatus Burarchaeum australiense]
MKIADLKAGTGNVNLDVEVVNVEEPREVLTKFGKRLRVANATIKDDSGEMTMTLWGDDIDRIKGGDSISIQNGWVSEFKGNVQISAGKYGKIEVK